MASDEDVSKQGPERNPRCHPVGACTGDRRPHAQHTCASEVLLAKVTLSAEHVPTWSYNVLVMMERAMSHWVPLSVMPTICWNDALLTDTVTTSLA